MTITKPHQVLFSAAQLEARVAELAAQISREYADHPLHLVGVLRGGLPFLCDLARRLDLKTVTMDFLSVRRKLDQQPELIFDLDSPLAGRHVLLVEDLVSEGKTLAYVHSLLELRQPASLKVCALLRRGTSEELKVDYTGWEVSDKFLVGYGLDLEERYRNLPFVAELT